MKNDAKTLSSPLEFRADLEEMASSEAAATINEILSEGEGKARLVTVWCRDERHADEISQHLSPSKLKWVQYLWSAS